MSDSSLQREMAHVAGALFAFGAALLALAVLVPTWPDAHRPALLLYAGVAAVTALVLEVSAHRRPMSTPALMGFAVLGIITITLIVVAGGPDAAAALAVFHVFILAYGFFYFPRWWAITEVALVGASYGAALAWLDVPGAWSQWLLVTGAYTTVGALLGNVGRRLRASLANEVRSTDRLRELDDVKTTFLRAVAHELRTPLTNVVGYATTLRTHRDQLPAARIDELIDRTVSNANKLERLLTDLLDLERVARGIVTLELAPTDVGQLARDVTEQLDFGQHPLHVDTGPVITRADASKLERVIENLLANAIKHTGRDAAIWLTVEDADDGALITVEDNGPGVPDALKQALFEPFEQGPDARSSPSPGTGIGLSLVQRFTELHHGRVWVEDRAGGGARFQVLIPHTSGPDTPTAPPGQRDTGETDAPPPAPPGSLARTARVKPSGAPGGG